MYRFSRGQANWHFDLIVVYATSNQGPKVLERDATTSLALP